MPDLVSVFAIEDRLMGDTVDLCLQMGQIHALTLCSRYAWMLSRRLPRPSAVRSLAMFASFHPNSRVELIGFARVSTQLYLPRFFQSPLLTFTGDTLGLCTI